MEYLQGGTLFDICIKTGGMNEPMAHFFTCQLVDAMQNVHKNEIVHLDLKLENIISDELFNLKIADFGMATNK